MNRLHSYFVRVSTILAILKEDKRGFTIAMHLAESNPKCRRRENTPHQLVHLPAEPLRLIGHPVDGGLEGIVHLQVLLLLRRLAGHREQLQGEL